MTDTNYAKKISIITLTLGVIFLAGCKSEPVGLPISEEMAFSLGQTYTVGSQEATSKNVYGVVVGDNLKSIFSSVGGMISDIDCQPGKKVTPDTIIARITPNEDDPTTQNMYLQQEALENQLRNLQESYALTEQNFDLQLETLQAQTENNQDIYSQDSADLQKLEHSIQNFKDQQQNTINDAFKKVRDNAAKLRNSNMYQDLYDQRNDLEEMSDIRFSPYLQDMANLMKKASGYASGDTMYAAFMGLSNGFLASKSAFDTLIDTYKSAQNAYDNQHNNLGLSIDLSDQQAQAIQNNKEIQLNLLDNQKQTLEQTLASLSNTLEGEDLYAGVDGVVKAKGVGADNKVSPNTLICQIVPLDSVNKKIQIFSADKIKIGQIVKLSNGDTIIGAAKIQYEIPYKDPATQNYIYEIIDPSFKLKEGDRLTIQFFQKLENTEVWIPVSFVFSKLDGNYVRIQAGSGFIETKAELGDINGSLVKVMSGVSMGQVILN